MLNKEQAPVRLEDATHFGQCRRNVRNCAQSPRGHDGIDTRVFEWNSFGRTFQKCNSKRRSSNGMSSHRQQFFGWIDADHLICRLTIVGKIQAGTNSYFQHTTFGSRHHSITIRSKRFLTHRHVDEIWNYSVFIKSHGPSNYPRHPQLFSNTLRQFPELPSSIRGVEWVDERSFFS